jgi:hypothetical protein
MMLQVIRRKHFSKLPLQANYYALPTMAFIQDQKFRFTIVTAQPLGIGSLKEGQVEVSYGGENLLWIEAKETLNISCEILASCSGKYEYGCLPGLLCRVVGRSRLQDYMAQQPRRHPSL